MLSHTHFKEEKTEAQRGRAIFPQPLSMYMWNKNLELCLPDSHTRILNRGAFIQQALTEHTVWAHGNITVNTQTQVSALIELTFSWERQKPNQ